ncbi:MAG TPA: hypothetical protein VGK85_11010 [Myxococcaceae bacterium]|jgi:hypothetical protein
MDERTGVMGLEREMKRGILAVSMLALAPLERVEKRLPHPKLDDKHQTEA